MVVFAQPCFDILFFFFLRRIKENLTVVRGILYFYITRNRGKLNILIFRTNKKANLFFKHTVSIILFFYGQRWTSQ